MSRIRYILLQLFVGLFVISSNVSAELWRTVAPSVDSSHYESNAFDIKANKFHLLDFDAGSLQLQNKKRQAIRLDLPMPTGTFETFELVEIAMMEIGLANKFPDIHTYRGYSLNDRSKTVVLDITNKGLHAVIKSPNHTVWIDPVSRTDNVRHMSYYQSDYAKKSDHWQCMVDDIQQSSAIPIDDINEKQKSINGNPLPTTELVLKTYRLAMATTGEYAQFHSSPNAANVGDTMSAVITAMNRVNGIYEKELGIRMILVANNDQIIFTDAATDGYTNNDGFAMLDENQDIIDNIIGSANYDIGHVFSTGGGGIAGLRVPCSSFRKAEGVTGLASPINDVFYVDYVSHEIGHQWGANHIFNSVNSFCNGNRSSSSAVEPGSGTTILSYAGICGADDIQNNSDAYFNSFSLEEITNFSNNGGASCVVNVNTNNQAPTVEAGNNYTIPKLTPFRLCAVASDPDSTNITYNWEQHDFGPAGSPNSPVANAPIFRSFESTLNNCRTFPQISDIVGQVQTKGEILPSYARGLNFRVTARDNEVTGGAFSTDDLQLTVTNDGPFQITTQNLSENLTGGQSITVNWDVANTNQAPVNCSELEVSFSQDGGLHFLAATSQIANTGSASIVVPFLNTNQAKIKLKCSNNIFFDINNADLSILSTDLIFTSGFE
ncbi:MAG: hypothetical protein JKY19_01155 [Alcanivoracaceae bacterium]|nr:hypothetical protein [Alcanivoracaceae bacterium]